MPMHRQRLTKIAAHPGNEEDNDDSFLTDGKREDSSEKINLDLGIGSFMGFNPQNCDHNIMTEPDLGRCRRTDGRKWRCSKSVVANEKYCERHMHRGRNRSRKHVETIGTVLKPQKQISGADDDNNIVVCLSALGDEVNKNINVESKESSFKDANHSNISIRKHCEMKNNVGPISCGFGLSPKSVLHCSAGKVRPGLKSENIIENELRRCERKDGKKRQCKQDVVANQKFCEVNMHRRAKRVISNQESDIPATSALRARLSCTSSRSPENGINLKIMPSSPGHISGNNCTSSTSDATTISDETISFCL